MTPCGYSVGANGHFQGAEEASISLLDCSNSERCAGGIVRTSQETIPFLLNLR
jgi:hypothetical protein